MDDLISIILPVYNGEKYLSESVDSILSQTYKTWELIIVDDGSTDNTASIAQQFAKRDSRIKYFRNEHNLRLPRSLNKGFSLASGQYLTWTSDDNLYYSKALEVMLTALKNSPSAQFAFCNYDIIDENGKLVLTQRIPNDYDNQIVGNNIVGACFLYTRLVYEKIGDYQHGRLLVEDFDYWQRIFAKYAVAPVYQTLYQYRIHSSSLTGTTDVSITNSAYEETILCNRGLFGKLNLPQKYYFYYALYRCERSRGSKKYIGKYLYYKLVYYYPRRLIEKCHGKNT